MLKGIVQAFRWLGKHWALTTTVALILAIIVTTVVCWNAFGKEKVEMVPIYVTVTGLGEGKDFANRELMVPDNSSIYEIFSLKNPEIYEDFGQPLIMNNVFQSFMGVRPSGNKQFYVKIGGTYENILPQAYIWKGAVVEVEYR
ncbi:MAG: hypothetical protein IJP27_05860 [Clostridia bacterium]|nr:hypothetical protein [Clostridia bacterium]